MEKNDFLKKCLNSLRLEVDSSIVDSIILAVNAQNIELLNWLGKEDLKKYAEGWCQPGGSNGFHLSTEDLLITYKESQ